MPTRTSQIARRLIRLALLACILHSIIAEDDPIWRAFGNGKSGSKHADVDSPVRHVGAKDSETASPLDAVVHDLSQAQSTKVLKFPTCIYRTGNVNINIGPQDALGVQWAGWGTALARAGRYIGGRSDPNDRKQLLRLLFDPKTGLGLTRIRYQIPPGFNRATSPGVWSSYDHDWSSYLVDPTKGAGRYNLSADWKQVLAVQEAVQLGASVGRKIHVDAISLSPPWWMTVSKDVAGGASGQQNIRLRDMTTYAQFLITLMRRFETDLHVRVDTLTAMNEPLEGWWVKGQIRPGCGFTFEAIKTMYAALQAQKRAQGLSGLALAGVDSWHPSSENLLTWTYRNETPPWQVFTVHGYRAAEGQAMDSVELGLKGVRQAAADAGLPIWQTEWGPWRISGSEMEIALFMGRSIAEHINILGASAWFHYLALQVPNDIQWGAIQIDMYAKAVNPLLTKQFYAMLHFSRHILPGSRILRIPQQCQHGVVAAYTPQTNQLTVTAVNQREESFLLNVQLSGFRLLKGVNAARVYFFVTTRHSNFKLERIETRTEVMTERLHVTPSSITTIVMHNVTLM